MPAWGVFTLLLAQPLLPLLCLLSQHRAQGCSLLGSRRLFSRRQVAERKGLQISPDSVLCAQSSSPTPSPSPSPPVEPPPAAPSMDAEQGAATRDLSGAEALEAKFDQVCAFGASTHGALYCKAVNRRACRLGALAPACSACRLQLIPSRPAAHSPSAGSSFPLGLAGSSSPLGRRAPVIGSARSTLRRRPLQRGMRRSGSPCPRPSPLRPRPPRRSLSGPALRPWLKRRHCLCHPLRRCPWLDRRWRRRALGRKLRRRAWRMAWRRRMRARRTETRRMSWTTSCSSWCVVL